MSIKNEVCRILRAQNTLLNKRELVLWMQKKGLLLRSMICNKCKVSMKLLKISRQDGFQWWVAYSHCLLFLYFAVFFHLFLNLHLFDLKPRLAGIARIALVEGLRLFVRGPYSTIHADHCRIIWNSSTGLYRDAHQT